MRFTPVDPVLSSAKPLIGLFGLSGAGKTFSALRLARGIAGPSGLVVGADSERGRMAIFKNSLPGGFKTFTFEDTSPASYCDVIDSLEQSGAACGVIDSASHEWEGPGGVLEMALANEEASGKTGLHNWVKPKAAHKAFILRLLRCSIPLVVTLRAKFKTRQGKDERGKTVIVESERPEPIASDDFVFEMLVHGEIMPDHTFRLTKELPPDFGAVVPNGVMLTEEHGAAIMRYLNETAAPVVDETKQMKRELWKLTAGIHQNDKATGQQRLQQWLWDESLVTPEERMETLNAGRLAEVLAGARKKLIK